MPKKGSTKKTTKKEIATISLDNRPVDINIQEEKEVIPEKFVPQVEVPKEDNSLLIKNGRVYKRIGKNIGMYSDNGEVFRIGE